MRGALGLADIVEAQRKIFGEKGGEIEKILCGAGFQLQFKLAQRKFARAGMDGAFVESGLDARRSMRDQPRDPPDAGLVFRLQRRLADDFAQARGHVGVEPGNVRLHVRRTDFDLAARKNVARRQQRPFQGHDRRGAPIAAHAQGHPALSQRPVRRVEIDRDQFARRIWFFDAQQVRLEGRGEAGGVGREFDLDFLLGAVGRRFRGRRRFQWGLDRRFGLGLRRGFAFDHDRLDWARISPRRSRGRRCDGILKHFRANWRRFFRSSWNQV